MPRKPRRQHEGIVEKHSRKCPSLPRNGGGKCDCQPTFQAWYFDKTKPMENGSLGGKVYRSFPTISAARDWRRDAVGEVKRGTRRPPSRLTLREAAEQWLEACERGEVLSRFRRPYAPSALRGYRADLNRYVLRDLGAVKLDDVRRRDIQALVDRLNGTELSGSKIRNVIVPVQALYRWADRREMVNVDPTINLELPETGGRREWSCTPTQGAALLEALPEDVRAVFATALYAGLRRGELRALRLANVRILNGVGAISVEHGWDDVAGERNTKSAASVREVPMPHALRTILDAHIERLGLTGDALVFPAAGRTRGRPGSGPFTPGYVQDRADEAWASTCTTCGQPKDEHEDGEGCDYEPLTRATLHELRHGYESFLDAAGVPETRQRRYMGHADTSITGRYRHTIDGQLAEDAKRLDEYLAGAIAGKVVALKEAANA
jgi:integrase